MGSRRRKVGRQAEIHEDKEEPAEEVSESKSSESRPKEDPKEELVSKDDLLREQSGPLDGSGKSVGGKPPAQANFTPKHPLTMGPNKSVVCRRGRLNAGDEVKEDDFTADVLARLIEIGCVIDRRG